MGAYAFHKSSPAGTVLESEAAGFKKFIQSDIVIDVQQQVAVDPVLQIGQTSESVEVRGNAAAAAEHVDVRAPGLVNSISP